MGFQVRFNATTRVVSAIFFDRVDAAEKRAAARQMAEKYGHLHPLNVLVDVRQADIEMSVAEREAFGTYVAHLQGVKHGRIAVLHAPDYNANVVIDGVARAEGLNVLEFVTEQAALQWLAEGEKSRSVTGEVLR